MLLFTFAHSTRLRSFSFVCMNAIVREARGKSSGVEINREVLQELAGNVKSIWKLLLHVGQYKSPPFIHCKHIQFNKLYFAPSRKFRFLILIMSMRNQFCSIFNLCQLILMTLRTTKPLLLGLHNDTECFINRFVSFNQKTVYLLWPRFLSPLKPRKNIIQLQYLTLYNIFTLKCIAYSNIDFIVN